MSVFRRRYLGRLRLELGRIAAVARGAIDGDAIKSRLDMPTLDHVLAVEEWRNGRKWAVNRQSGFGFKSPKSRHSKWLAIWIAPPENAAIHGTL